MLPDEALDKGALLELTRALTGSPTAAVARHNVAVTGAHSRWAAQRPGRVGRPR